MAHDHDWFKLDYNLSRTRRSSNGALNKELDGTSRTTSATMKSGSQPLVEMSGNSLPPPGIDESLPLERKIESRKRNFSLDLENLIVSISLSTLDFREW